MNKTRKTPVLLGLWLLSIVGLLVILGQIYLPLSPSALAEAKTLDARGRWKVVHILAAGSPRSESVSLALVRRGAAAEGVEEAIVLLGQDLTIAARMRAAGWFVAIADPEESHADYGIGGAPWLLIYDPSGELRYSAYQSGSASKAAYEGAAILRRLRSEGDPQARPVSDPTKLRYASAVDYTPPPLPVP